MRDGVTCGQRPVLRSKNLYVLHIRQDRLPFAAAIADQQEVSGWYEHSKM